ncbi:calcium-binding protein [Umezawaea beigongshangensis]|uniref:calcium-binding protein n=1 Tax=Umezawaea beigongshangensis TaxID=2780383 RepID=UPI0018F1C0A6|nr:calcium-binding protein [Umezawaea beigongshangensis]
MRIQQSQIRRGAVVALAGFLAVPFLSAVTPLTAHAAVDCVVSAGVTQTDTVVTGTPGNDTIDCGGTNPGKTINGNAGNDTITGSDFNDTINGGDGNDTLTGGTGDDTLNGGLGIDTISGSAGNDILVGASNDGSQDSLDGGLGTDTCQGPAPDPDIHANCENTSTPPTTGPGSGLGNATVLCTTTGGVLSLTVNPVGYVCVFNPLSSNNRRVPEARAICTGAGGTFVNALPAAYSCLLPTTH